MTAPKTDIIRCNKCVIGEGPIWNDFDKKLYFVNSMGPNEICTFDPQSREITAQTYDQGTAAIAFSKEGKMLVSRPNGAFYLAADGTQTPLYDTNKYTLRYCNDAKVGPDGRFYVGTQSEKRLGISDNLNGKLYSIDKNGNVRLLLEGMRLSNGMEWSLDEKFFYHTDSDTGIIKEYAFDKQSGDIEFTGRQINIPCVDGFTINQKGELVIACWGKSHLAIADTKTMTLKEHVKLPISIPTSCGFYGEGMEYLAITTASYKADTAADPDTGYLCVTKMNFGGRKPYLFG